MYCPTPDDSPMAKNMALKEYHAESPTKMSLEFILNSKQSRMPAETRAPPAAKDRHYQVAEERLLDLADSMPVITHKVKEDVLKLFQACMADMNVRKEVESGADQLSVYLSGCVLVAFQQTGIPLQFREVSIMFGYSKETIVRAYKDVLGLVSNQEDTFDLPTAVTGIAERLQFPRDVIQECRRLSYKISRVLAGRNLKSVAAIIVYCVGVKANIPNLTRKDVAIISGVSDVTLWSLAKIVNANKHCLE